MQTEMTELRQYKAELAEKIRENQEIIDMKSPSLEEVQQYNRLTEEKVKRWFPTSKLISVLENLITRSA